MLANPVIAAPIVGANTVAQLTDTMGAVEVKLAGEEINIIRHIPLHPCKSTCWMTMVPSLVDSSEEPTAFPNGLKLASSGWMMLRAAKAWGDN
jgi:hypothetical protein